MPAVRQDRGSVQHGDQVGDPFVVSSANPGYLDIDGHGVGDLAVVAQVGQ